MPHVNSIKKMDREGTNVTEIARKLGIDEKTVRKYLHKEDFSLHPPEPSSRPSNLDPHKPRIDRWLLEDQARWHKQRHTAQRIHDRLRVESPGYAGSYNTVQRYVKASLLSLGAQRASQELVWHPTSIWPEVVS